MTIKKLLLAICTSQFEDAETYTWILGMLLYNCKNFIADSVQQISLAVERNGNDAFELHAGLTLIS
jgi:hypothetical protein